MDEQNLDAKPSPQDDEDDTVQALPEGTKEVVGYKRPPAKHRFKKGTSGNLRGRPAGSRNKPPASFERLQQRILNEGNRIIPVMDKGRMTEITLLDAILRSLSTKAAKGDFRSQQLFLTQVAEFEQKDRTERMATIEELLKARDHGLAELRLREEAGEKNPEIYPHPDDIYIDWRKMNGGIVGPWSAEEKNIWAQFDWALSMEFALDEQIKDLVSDISNKNLTTEENARKRSLIKILQKNKRKFEKITSVLSFEKKAIRLKRIKNKIEAGEGFGFSIPLSNI